MTQATLDQVATVVMGLSPKSDTVGPTPHLGLPLLNGPTEFGERSPVPRQWTSQWSRKSEVGDILFCVRGSTTGRMNRAQMQYAIGRGIAAIRGESALDTDYIFYSVVEGLPRLLALTSGSVFPNISASDLKGFELAWPKSSIRESISRTLGALDEKIESNRRVARLALEFLDALSVRVSAELPSVALGSLVSVARTSVNPAHFGDALVDHFSLPAFDDGARPELQFASTIMSSKLEINDTTILVSRLNPRINRTWWVMPRTGVSALASTEFAQLTADSAESLAAVWLAVRDGFFREELTRRVTGTSGSHQRVRPDDMLTIEVPDVSRLTTDMKEQILGLLELAERKRDEASSLERLRNTLLPELLSGRIGVPEASDVVDKAPT